MKGEMVKCRANRTDSKLSVRNGGGKAVKRPIRPMMPPFPPTDLGFFKCKTFEEQFWAKYPNNTSLVDLDIAAREVWITMSDADKAPYVKMAEESMKEYEMRKKEFGKRIAEYNEYIYAACLKNSQDSAMKDGKSKSRANRNDSKLTVRNGGGKAAKGLIRPTKPPYPLSHLDFFKRHEFRKQFRAKYPNNKSFVALHNAALVEWETMGDADKAPFVEMAEESMIEYVTRRMEFRKRIAEYNECIAADYKSSQAATEGDEEGSEGDEEGGEEVRINLAGLMIRQ